MAAMQAGDRNGAYQNNEFWTNAGGVALNSAKIASVPVAGPLVAGGISAAAGATDLVGNGLGRVLGTTDANGAPAPAFTANSMVGTGMHLMHDAARATWNGGVAAAPYVQSAASSLWGGVKGLASGAADLFSMYGG